MKRHSKHSIYNPYADINVVPLVDLTFNLLIIFMLATPLLETSINLKLPTAQAGEAVDEKLTRVVSVDRNGRVLLDEVPVRLDVLRAQLEQAVAKDPQIPVLVRADESVAYRDFVAIVDILKSAGVKRMGIMTHPK